ncbi:helix-turn-helix domain-containing protein [Lewinella sp. JB7]|uniref:helix-turn-helix domain-containing protein n=1 Tax=Lewinella sp. JB7 TaxID=2962887 RepID=UPI0020C9DE2F|nr:helix-turn-helix transcriptional regulator [Lewinella sp. JB7]MCP9237921.1 helix-turn-helix domain-containing protein [Lewinella sp. JB7]
MAYSEADIEKLKSFGLKIKELREALGLSQLQLSFKADLDRTYIGSLERGYRNVSLLNIHKLAEALEVPVAILVDGHPQSDGSEASASPPD